MELRRGQLHRLLTGITHPVTLVAVCLAGIAVSYSAENALATVPFAMAVLATIAASLFLISKRLAFSIYVAWMLVAIETLVSAIKFQMRGFSFHFYDAVFVASDKEVYPFLVGSYLHLVLLVLLALASCVAFAIGVFRLDTARSFGLSGRWALLGLSALLLPLTLPADASEERHSYYLRGRHITAFFVSFLDLEDYFTETDLQKRLAETQPQTKFEDSVDCGDLADQPDVFVVLEESAADMADFPQVAGAGDFIHRYAPSTGEVHPMGVEVFGAGTWISNLSLMTGLSSSDFGWRSPYLTITLQDRVKGALPDLFKRCGYRTVALTPFEFNFANEGRFLGSIGFDEVIDYHAMGLPTYHMRDKSYFDAAERLIAEHHKVDKRPLFLAIQTMFAHSDYDLRMEPDLVVAGEPFNVDPQVNEYVRRLASAQSDFEAFLQHRKSDPAGRESVVLEFGDHQSYVLRPFVDAKAGPDALVDKSSFAYRTYYAITAFNRDLDRSAVPRGRLDIAYLGATLLDVAHLPSSPMMRDLIGLRDHCQGQFYLCADRPAVDAHLRRRIDAGMLDILRGAMPGA